MFPTGLANDLQGIDKKIHRPTKLISQGKQVGYFYDKHGRVKTKTLTPVDKDGVPLRQSSQSIVGYLESLQLFYTPNNQLEKSIKIHQQGFEVTTTTTHYFYDAFGRRIGKSSSTQKSSKLNQRGQLVRFPSNLSSLNTTDRPQRKNTLMLWDGNRQIQEYTDEQIFTTVYEQNSFEPVARVVQLASHIEQKRLADIAYETRRFVRIGESEETINQRIQDKSQPLINIYHYHCNHLGTPQELTNQDGDVIWLSYDRAWGGSFDTIYKQQFVDNFALDEFELQPIKFQGQSLDIETGLHYNRFRYYDSDVGMFISRDPIGLLGGSNVFQYAPNPVMWIDPWGLSQTYWLDKALATAERPVGAGQTAHHIVKFSSNQNEYSRASKGILDRAGIDIDSASNGARLWGTAGSQKSVNGHPGKGAYNYHGGNVHTPYSDYRVMKLLERAEKSGKPDAVKNMLEAIGRKMEDGRWRTPKENGKYKKPPSLKNPCNGVGA